MDLKASISNALTSIPATTLVSPRLGGENKEHIIRQYLQKAAAAHNIKHLQVLMSTLAKLTEAHLITAHHRMLCFKLINKLISHVDYTGVREVLKVCHYKGQFFRLNINVSYLPQLLALEDIIKHIFDRKNCLLPAYFIVNEILKPFPYHWKFNKLTTDFVDEFRRTPQTVSIISHAHMFPIVELFGYADHLMNSWKLDPNTLKFILKDNLPYESELFAEQSQLLRYVLEQTCSKEMVPTMLNLQKQQKQR
uniref:Mediator of RNA polymerase II transcription subunit 23 n=1 Tax=Glossina austeni TaxID=7395 RepID=A0A1A9VQ90_GLOAU